MKTITVFGTGALALALGMSAPAEAQLVLSEGRCHPAEPCENVGESCDGGGVCVMVEARQPFCISRTAVPCCNADTPCPTFDGVMLECNPIAGLTTSGGDDAALCVEPFEYCVDTLEGVRRCHTESEDSTVRLGFLDGDCDRDGLSNGEEMEIGSNHCEAPLRRGVDLDGTCVAVPSPCSLDEPCTVANGDTGQCRLTEGMNGTRCFALGAPGRELFCADDPFDCASDELVVTVRDRDFCVKMVCAGADIDIEDCIRDVDGEPVPFAEGDCDRDEATNGAELLAETDPCAAPDEPIDAGTPVDAGGQTVEPDAGPEPVEDSGTGGIDAGGDPIDPRFEGGGGCSCRASGGSRGSGAWLVGLAGLAIVARRRR